MKVTVYVNGKHITDEELSSIEIQNEDVKEIISKYVKNAKENIENAFSCQK